VEIEEPEMEEALEWLEEEEHADDLGEEEEVPLPVDTEVEEEIDLPVCNDPKPLCKDHHYFGVFFKTFSSCGISSNSLLIYCLLVFICVYAANNKNRQP
jgi:hypothetical protein